MSDFESQWEKTKEAYCEALKTCDYGTAFRLAKRLCVGEYKNGEEQGEFTYFDPGRSNRGN
jgi:hypothetical protein